MRRWVPPVLLLAVAATACGGGEGEAAEGAAAETILTWHEIVNDTIAGAPVAVTYCPLCNTAIAFDRRVEDRVLDFGTSGRL